MEVTFDLSVAIPKIGLTDFPYTSGVLTILSPIGTTVYTNSAYESPDFTDPDDVVEKTLPNSVVDGQTIQGEYSVQVKDATGLHPSTTYLPVLARESYAATISVFQDCNVKTALVNYALNAPEDAVLVSTTWTITDPNNAETTETDPSFTIDPIISGTYTISLVLIFYTTQTVGGAEVFVKQRVFASYSYTNTCSNALAVLCSMYCCLKTAFFNYVSSPTSGNLAQMVATNAAATLVNMTISCNKEQEAQEILNKLNSKYYCADCGECSGC